MSEKKPTVETAGPGLPPPRGPWKMIWIRLRKNRIALLGVQAGRAAAADDVVVGVRRQEQHAAARRSREGLGQGRALAHETARESSRSP